MVINHNISFVTLVFCLIYVRKKNYCKTVSLNACGLLLLLWTNLENISRILIFADLILPRNFAKIRRRENFPFYGNTLLQSDDLLRNGVLLNSWRRFEQTMSVRLCT